MNTITIKDMNYRIKKMNAIEALAVQANIGFENENETYNTYLILLEKIEVQVKDDNWLPVKNGNEFYPKDIEFDSDAIKKLIKFAIRSH